MFILIYILNSEKSFGALTLFYFIIYKELSFPDRSFQNESRNGIYEKDWKYLILFENVKWKEQMAK